ncbi:tripartite tricarboxylate transporter TctB family protein [Salinicola avicenniae]|uniref:tripartite tricarboxylate transporter TctB family protein n=1 Tax=Salinicola avicenniae TaxID=2916836 RepID=UPI002073C5A5|nr:MULTISPECIES: tripartite tricarboxylate transporter TctB family protein [unclassified Salinicola]
MNSRRFRLGGGFYFPAGLAVITLIYLVDAFRLGPPMRDGNMTASFFPIATALIMLVALAFAMWHSLRGSFATSAPNDTADEAEAKTNSASPALADRRYLGLSPGAIGVIGLTAGYLIAFDAIGYFFATALYVLLLCLLFGGIREKLPSKIIATAVITLAGYLLFEIVFQVRLPTLWSQ